MEDDIHQLYTNIDEHGKYICMFDTLIPLFTFLNLKTFSLFKPSKNKALRVQNLIQK